MLQKTQTIIVGSLSEMLLLLGLLVDLLSIDRSQSLFYRKCLLAPPGGVAIRTYWHPLGGGNKNLLAPPQIIF